MAEGSLVPRMALAALASAAIAGLVLGGQLGLLMVSPSGYGGASGLRVLAGAAAIGLVAGLVIATLPAFLAGAVQWGLQGRYEPARRRTSWAFAGAGVGGLLGVLFLTLILPAGLDGFAVAAFAAFLAAGMPAALVFRATMRATGGLSPWSTEPD